MGTLNIHNLGKEVPQMEKILKIYRKERVFIVENISQFHLSFKRFNSVEALFDYLEQYAGQLDQYRLEVSDDLQETISKYLK